MVVVIVVAAGVVVVVMVGIGMESLWRTDCLWWTSHQLLRFRWTPRTFSSASGLI